MSVYLVAGLVQEVGRTEFVDKAAHVPMVCDNVLSRLVGEVLNKTECQAACLVPV
jgi:hypothetical protein